MAEDQQGLEALKAAGGSLLADAAEPG
jgi:hypothetical protein